MQANLFDSHKVACLEIQRLVHSTEASLTQWCVDVHLLIITGQFPKQQTYGQYVVSIGRVDHLPGGAHLPRHGGAGHSAALSPSHFLGAGLALQHCLPSSAPVTTTARRITRTRWPT